jgi:hypothetical protein
MDASDRAEGIVGALTAYTESQARRTETIEFRGSPISLEVIRVKASLPLLNQDNSRLTAQLMTHEKREMVFDSPTSSESQDVLSELLRRTDKFLDLRRELKELGQQHPGIITRQGVLINGNTRLVAARDNSAEGFDVAVLPIDANSEDCLEIEMSLQLRKLTHQDYTLTNRLLLISRYIERGHTGDELIKHMGWSRGGKKKLEQSQRLLGIVEEVREVSDVPLDYRFFDDKEQSLKDLDQKYEALAPESLSEARNMKWLRITGMILGVNKDQVRAIDEDFMDNALLKRVENNDAGRFLERFARVPGQDSLDDLLGSVDTIESRIDTREVVATLLNSVQDQFGNLDDQKLDDFHELKKAIRTGADAIIDDEKQNQLRSQPSERLSEARMRIEEIGDRLPDLFKDPVFDSKKFGFEVKKLQKAVASLSEELSRQNPSS